MVRLRSAFIRSIAKRTVAGCSLFLSFGSGRRALVSEKKGSREEGMVEGMRRWRARWRRMWWTVEEKEDEMK